MAHRDEAVVIAGYYGNRNWGDEASLTSLLQVIPPAQAHVLSSDPEWTQAVYGAHAVPHRSLSAVRRVLKESSALLLGGGSLLQDTTSLRSLIYYLTLIRLAKRHQRKVLLVAQGIGPLRRPMSRWLTKHALKETLITVRDPASAALLKEIGIRQPIQQFADITWALKVDEEAVEKILNLGSSPERPLIGLAPRAWSGMPVQNAFASLSVSLIKEGFTPVLVPMQETQDRPLCEQIAQAAQAESGQPVLVTPPMRHPYEVVTLFRSFQWVLAIRLHAMIFSAKEGVPVIGVPYDPKVQALCDTLKIPVSTVENLFSAWQRNRMQQESLIARLKESITPLEESANRCLSWVVQEIGQS